MTVESAINRAGPFDVAIVPAVFPRPFLALDASHVRVIRDRGGVEADLTTGISHAGIGAVSGSVTVSEGLEPGDRVTILRAVPNVQRSDYSAQGRVAATQVEADLDNLQMQIQDIRELQGRALTLPASGDIDGVAAISAALAAPGHAAAAQTAAAAAASAATAAANAAAQVGSITFASVATLQASTTPLPLGAMIVTRAEGWAFEVVASGGHRMTAGGAHLRAVWRGNGGDLLAAGVDLTGATSASAILSAYLTARAGQTAIIPAGTYLITATVDIPGGTNVQMAGCTFDLSSLTTGAASFRSVGSQDAAVAMSAQPTKGQSNIYLASTAGMVSGDVLRVTSDAIFDPDRTGMKIGELARIKEVFSDRVVLHSPLMDDYTVGANGRVHKITPVRGVTISGPALFEGADRTNCKGIWIEKAIDCRVSSLRFRRFDDRALWLQDCDNLTGENLTFEDFDAPSTGYGISCIDATQHCRFTNIHGRRVRHLFATNNTSASNGIPRRIVLDGFSVDASALAEGGTGGDALDTHAASEDIHFWNGTIRNATGCGINMEGAGGSVRNVHVLRAATHGIYAANFSARAGRIEITDCVAEDCGQSGVRVSAGGNQSWAAVTIRATIARAGAFPIHVAGSEAKLALTIDATIQDSGGSPMLYVMNGRDGHVRVRSKGQTDAAGAVYLCRLRDCIGVTADVQGRMNNSNPASRGLLIDKTAGGTMRNVMAIVNLRNEQAAGTGVEVGAGGTNIVIAATRVIDNFATAITGAA